MNATPVLTDRATGSTDNSVRRQVNVHQADLMFNKRWNSPFVSSAEVDSSDSFVSSDSVAFACTGKTVEKNAGRGKKTRAERTTEAILLGDDPYSKLRPCLARVRELSHTEAIRWFQENILQLAVIEVPEEGLTFVDWLISKHSGDKDKYGTGYFKDVKSLSYWFENLTENTKKAQINSRFGNKTAIFLVEQVVRFVEEPPKTAQVLGKRLEKIIIYLNKEASPSDAVQRVKRARGCSKVTLRQIWWNRVKPKGEKVDLSKLLPLVEKKRTIRGGKEVYVLNNGYQRRFLKEYLLSYIVRKEYLQVAFNFPIRAIKYVLVQKRNKLKNKDFCNRMLKFYNKTKDKSPESILCTPEFTQDGVVLPETWEACLSYWAKTLKPETLEKVKASVELYKHFNTQKATKSNTICIVADDKMKSFVGDGFAEGDEVKLTLKSSSGPNPTPKRKRATFYSESGGKITVRLPNGDEQTYPSEEVATMVKVDEPGYVKVANNTYMTQGDYKRELSFASKLVDAYYFKDHIPQDPNASITYRYPSSDWKSFLGSKMNLEDACDYLYAKPDYVCFLYANRFPVSKLSKEMEKAKGKKILLHIDTTFNSVAAKDNIQHWYFDIDKKYIRKPAQLMSVPQPKTFSADRQHYEIKTMDWIDDVKGDKYIVVSNTHELQRIKRMLPKYFIKRGAEVGKNSLVRIFGNDPSSSIETVGGLRKAGTENVTVCTTEFAAMLPPKDDVYLVGQGWTKERVGQAVKLALKNVYEVIDKTPMKAKDRIAYVRKDNKNAIVNGTYNASVKNGYNLTVDGKNKVLNEQNVNIWRSNTFSFKTNISGETVSRTGRSGVGYLIKNIFETIAEEKKEGNFELDIHIKEVQKYKTRSMTLLLAFKREAERLFPRKEFKIEKNALYLYIEEFKVYDKFPLEKLITNDTKKMVNAKINNLKRLLEQLKWQQKEMEALEKKQEGPPTKKRRTTTMATTIL
jgi:hypothetical protein